MKLQSVYSILKEQKRNTEGTVAKFVNNARDNTFTVIKDKNNDVVYYYFTFQHALPPFEAVGDVAVMSIEPSIEQLVSPTGIGFSYNE